ncbi:hypothetical protein SUDANB51_07285 [Streptomyces sp. enrichment culture]
MLKSSGKGHPTGGQRPVTTAGPPSLAALGLAGGDGTEPADPLTGRAAPPLTLIRGPFG